MALTSLDYDDIKQLSARFAQALDFGDADAFVAAFAPDGVLAVEGRRYETTDDLRRYVAETVASWEGHFRHTIAVSPLIAGDGDEARALSYGCFTRDYGPPHGEHQTTRASLVLSGVYEDTLVRIDGTWLLAERRFFRDGTPEVLRRVGQPLEIAAVDAGTDAEELTPLDYEAIRQLTTRYGYTLDFSDEDGFADCFTADGYFEILTLGDPDFGGQSRIEGTEGLRQMVGWLAPRVKGHVRHGVMNAVVAGDGRRALVSSYAFFTSDHGEKPRHTEPDSFMIETTGVYRDEVVKQDGVWRFAGRTFRYDGWPDVVDLAGKPLSFELFHFADA